MTATTVSGSEDGMISGESNPALLELQAQKSDFWPTKPDLQDPDYWNNMDSWNETLKNWLFIIRGKGIMIHHALSFPPQRIFFNYENFFPFTQERITPIEGASPVFKPCHFSPILAFPYPPKIPIASMKAVIRLCTPSCFIFKP